jgi:hypothetical protein
VDGRDAEVNRNGLAPYAGKKIISNIEHGISNIEEAAAEEKHFIIQNSLFDIFIFLPAWFLAVADIG